MRQLLAALLVTLSAPAVMAESFGNPAKGQGLFVGADIGRTDDRRLRELSAI